MSGGDRHDRASAPARPAAATPGANAEMRLLRYDAPAVLAGLEHHAGNLRCLLREAHATGRLAVLPPLTLHRKHNFGHARDWRWQDYYDLDASTLIDAAGREHPLPIAPIALAWAGQRGGGATPLVVHPGEHIPPNGTSHPLVVRTFRRQLFKNEVPQEGQPPVELQLRPAEPVLRLAQRTSQHLASLARQGDAPENGYVGVHVRRGDRLGEFEFPSERTEPPHIKAVLTRMAVYPAEVLFIASDERDPGFFDPLRACYRVLRYTDFPYLQALVSGDDPDNYLLYQVEKEVLRRARLWIETLPGRGPHAHASLVDAKEWRRSNSGRLRWWLRRARFTLRRSLPSSRTRVVGRA